MPCVEMTSLDTVVTWVDARTALPPSGTPVAAAITGRYPVDEDAGSDTTLGEEFWLVDNAHSNVVEIVLALYEFP